MKHVSVIAMVASDQTSQHVRRVHLYGDAGVVAAATIGADLVLTRAKPFGDNPQLNVIVLAPPG